MTGVFSKLRSAATKRRVHSLIDAGWSCFVQKGCRARKSPNAWAFTSTRLANGAAGSCRRSEEHTSELQSLMRISYAVFCLTKKIVKPTEIRHRQRYSTSKAPIN